MRWERSLIIWVVVTFIGLLMACAESEVDTKVADYFKVKCSNVRRYSYWDEYEPLYDYGSSVFLRAGAPGRRAITLRRVRSLLLTCEIEILRPDLVFGVCLTPVIEQVTDVKGQNISTSQSKPRPTRLYYEGLYQSPHRPLRVRPYVAKPEPIGLPRNPPRSNPVRKYELSVSGGRRLEVGLTPQLVEIELDRALCERAGGEIRRLKGHFYALRAESFEYVDVPFEPNDNWVRLTPDSEIQVREAWQAESSYRYEIVGNLQKGVSTSRLTVDSNLPSRIVVARQLIEEDGKPYLGPGGSNLHLGVPFVEGRSAHAVGSRGRIVKIRYVIAANPKQREIPFELEHIPPLDPAEERRCLPEHGDPNPRMLRLAIAD